jgi:hypothetical protein
MNFKEYLIGGKTYRIAIPLVWVFCLFGILLSGLTLAANDFSDKNVYYAVCPSVQPCFNNFYESKLCGVEIPSDDVLCTMKMIPPINSSGVLQPGFIGTPPPWLFMYFYEVFFGGAFIFLLINHLLFNRKFFSYGGNDL